MTNFDVTVLDIGVIHGLLLLDALLIADNMPDLVVFAGLQVSIRRPKFRHSKPYVEVQTIHTKQNNKFLQ